MNNSNMLSPIVLVMSIGAIGSTLAHPSTYCTIGLNRSSPPSAVVENQIYFGEIEIGKRKDTLRAMAVINAGTDPLEIRSIRQLGPNKKDFIMLSETGMFSLLPGDTARVDVRFMPSDTGRMSGRLQFEYKDGAMPATIWLTGDGVVIHPPVPPTLEPPVSTDLQNLIETYRSLISTPKTPQWYRIQWDIIGNKDSIVKMNLSFRMGNTLSSVYMPRCVVRKRVSVKRKCCCPLHRTAPKRKYYPSCRGKTGALLSGSDKFIDIPLPRSRTS